VGVVLINEISPIRALSKTLDFELFFPFEVIYPLAWVSPVITVEISLQGVNGLFGKRPVKKKK
jgi:hypothetical protein